MFSAHFPGKEFLDDIAHGPLIQVSTVLTRARSLELKVIQCGWLCVFLRPGVVGGCCLGWGF